MEDSHRVGSATDTGNHSSWKFSSALEHLPASLSSNHRLEFTHHARVRCGPDNRSNYVVAVVDVSDPVANCFARRVLESFRTARYGNDFGSHELHSINVERLTP